MESELQQLIDDHDKLSLEVEERSLTLRDRTISHRLLFVKGLRGIPDLQIAINDEDEVEALKLSLIHI